MNIAILAAAAMTAAAPAASPADGAAPMMAAPAATVAPRDPKYCVIVEHNTAQWLDRQVCRTRSDWLSRGFDPLQADQ